MREVEEVMDLLLEQNIAGEESENLTFAFWTV